MKLRIQLFRLGMVVMTAVMFSMCSTDEGIRPNDDTAISSRGGGIISGGTGTTVNLIGLTLNNELVFLTVNSHGTTETGLLPITGLRVGETIIAIDKTKELFGLSSMSAIWKINPLTGTARPVGPNFTPAVTGELVGFDVSPTDNVIRVMTNDQNLRISTSNGQVIGQDPVFHISPLGLNGIAYLPAASGQKATLYALDIAGQKLYRQAPAGTGSVVLMGGTNFVWRLEGGFDIASNGVGYTVQYGHGFSSGGPGIGQDDVTQDNYRMHSVNLKSGAAASLGIVRPMIGLTVK